MIAFVVKEKHVLCINDFYIVYLMMMQEITFLSEIRPHFFELKALHSCYVTLYSDIYIHQYTVS